MDPAIPEVRDWLTAICAEIAENYPVDGVHLDFIRYPGTWWGLPNREESAMFCLPEAENLRWMELARYARLSFVERYMTWCFWRASKERELSVYHAVREVSGALAEPRWERGLVLSAAVWANPGAAGFRVAQTWWRWGDVVDYPVVMSYTRDTGLFSDYLDFTLSVRPDAVFGIGFLWPDMEAEAAREESEAKARGARGISYFDYTRLRNEVDKEKLLGKTESGKPGKGKGEGGPINDAFSDAPPQAFVREGKGLLLGGEDREFADYLLFLSTNPGRDLARMGLTREGFYGKIAGDVAAFKAIDMAVFPIGDELVEPPKREINFVFLPYENEDPEAVKKRAKDVKELPGDTTIYPRALDPLSKAVFSAKKGKREICPGPDGVYVFEVKREIGGGKRVKREDVSPELLPVYIGWTAKTRLEGAARAR